MLTEQIDESSVTAETLGTRYRRAHAAAKSIRTLGTVIKVAAIVLAVLLLVGGFASLGEHGSDAAFTTVLFAAVLTGFCGFVAGVLVSALSHLAACGGTGHFPACIPANVY